MTKQLRSVPEPIYDRPCREPDNASDSPSHPDPLSQCCAVPNSVQHGLVNENEKLQSAVARPKTFPYQPKSHRHEPRK